MKTPCAILKTLSSNLLGRNGALHGGEFRMLFLGSALAFALITTPGAGHAGEAEANESELVPASFNFGMPQALGQHTQYLLAQYPANTTDTSLQAAPTVQDTHTSPPDRFGDTATGKSHLIPAAEIVGFNLLLNRFNSLLSG